MSDATNGAGRPLVSVVVPVYNEERPSRRSSTSCSSSTCGSRSCWSTTAPRTARRPSSRGSRRRTRRSRSSRSRATAARAPRSAAASTSPSGDILLIQDADLEYSPSDIPALIDPLLTGKADAVFGTRLRGGAHPQRAHLFWHYAGNRFLTLLSNVLYNTTISDMEVGYKAFKGDLVRGLDLVSNDFRIEPELTAKILRLGPEHPPLRGADLLLRPLVRRGQEDHVARRLRRRRRARPLPLHRSSAGSSSQESPTITSIGSTDTMS